MRRGILSLLFLHFYCLVNAQLSVSTTEMSNIFEMGQTMNFVVNPGYFSGTATYKIVFQEVSPDLAPVIASGSIELIANQTTNIPFTLNEANFVQCIVEFAGEKSIAGAAFSPCQIEPYEPMPADFQDFWSGKKAELDQIPMNPQLTFHSSTAYSETYLLELDAVDNRKVYGWISIPMGNGPFPALLSMPSAGNVANSIQPENVFAEQLNTIFVAISIHNGPLNSVAPGAYEHEDLTDPNGIYFRYAVQAGMRAIEYIHSRPDFDQENFGLHGISQGAGLATLLAGIDDRVDLLVLGTPALCEHNGLKYQRASGWPTFLAQSHWTGEGEDHQLGTLEAAKYYDAVYAASFYDKPVKIALSYQDEITRPATGFSLYNAFASEQKLLVHNLLYNHLIPNNFYTDRYDFIRTVWPTVTANPPNPMSNTTKSYFADAGADQSAATAQDITLSGHVFYNDIENTTWPVNWKILEAPGMVIIDNPSSRTTTASFSMPGIYKLQFNAHDRETRLSEEIFYQVSDIITIFISDALLPQSISFETLPNKLTIDPPFTLGASASSGLPVSYEIVSGPANVNGNTITLTGVDGEVIVAATQGGGSNYQAAEPVFRAFLVEKQDQTITFDPIPNKFTTDVPFNITAVATSNLPVTFTITSGPAQVNGDLIALNGIEGTVTVEASQWGDGDFYPAAIVSQSFEVSNISTNAEELSTSNYFNITPNPVKDFIIVDTDYNLLSANAHWSIYDATGKVVLSGSQLHQNQSISIIDLSSGTYFFKLEALASIHKFVKL